MKKPTEAMRRDIRLPGLGSRTYNFLGPLIIARAKQEGFPINYLFEKLFIEDETRRTGQTVTKYLGGLGLSPQGIVKLMEDLNYG